MARVALTPKKALGPYPVLPVTALAATLTFVGNATAADGVSFPLALRPQLLIVRNGDSNAQTCTIESVKDSQSRTGDIATYALAAGATAVFGPFAADGWRQTDGSIHAKGSHADVVFAVVEV